MSKRSLGFTLVWFIMALVITKLLISFLKSTPEVRTVSAIFLFTYSLAILSRPRVPEYREIRVKRYHLLVILFIVWIVARIVPSEPLDLSPGTIAVATLTGGATLLLALWLGAPRDEYIRVYQTPAYLASGLGILTVLAYISLISGIGEVMLAAPALAILMKRELRVILPAGEYARYLGLLSLPILFFAALTSLDLFNPMTDQICFVARAVWKDAEPTAAKHTYPAPLGAFIPEFVAKKLFLVNPWVPGLFIYFAMTLILLVSMMELARRLTGSDTDSYKWFLAGDATLLGILLVLKEKGFWEVGDYVSISWGWPAGFIAAPHRFSYMKSLTVISVSLSMLTIGWIPSSFAVLYLLSVEPVMALGMSPLILSRPGYRWRSILIGGLVGIAMYLATPSLMLEDLALHIEDLGDLFQVSPLVLIAIVFAIKRLRTHLLTFIRGFARSQIPRTIIAVLIAASILSPHRLPQLPTPDPMERVVSILSTLKYVAFPFSVWLLLRPPRSNFSISFILLLLAWIMAPFLFYEPLRVVDLIPFVFMFAAAEGGTRHPLAMILLLLSVPIGNVAFMTSDNLSWVAKSKLMGEMEENSLVFHRPWFIFSALKEENVHYLYMRRGKALALLMTPDPAYVLSLLPPNITVFDPEVMKDANYSFLTHSRRTILSAGECIAVPPRVDFRFLEGLWRRGATCYALPWGTAHPADGSLTMVLRIRNGTIPAWGIRIEDAALYPSLGYAFLVGRFSGGTNLTGDSASVSPYAPISYFPSNPGETGVMMTETIFRPYNLTHRVGEGILARTLAKGPKDIWLEGNASLDGLGLEDGVYWVYIFRWRSDGDEHSEMLFPMVFYKERNVTILPIPIEVRGSMEGYVTYEDTVHTEEFIMGPVDLGEDLTIEYATGNFLVFRR